MENKVDPSSCTGSGKVGHPENEYANIGFCPCGEFVAHVSNEPCNIIETATMKESYDRPDTCMCRTDSCPCGDFLSHKSYEPCTANQ